MTVTIRPYTSKDYDAVKINLEDGGLFNASVDTPFTLQAKIEAHPISILVAEVDDQVVGNVYVIYDPWNSFIFRLAVRQEFREHGIGSRLMEAAELHLRQAGVKDVSLFVRSDHQELIDYYLKRGYTPMERTHQCMYKEL